MTGLAQQEKWETIEQVWNEAEKPIIIIVLEIRKKPDEI